MTGILEQGVELGIFRKIDVGMTALQIIGICTFYANSYENMKHLELEQDFFSQAAIERYSDASVQLVLSGVREK
ncbi:hypothetical protein H6S82_29850 [Planktothrix sp. FACHB-1355]|uniref:HTH-type transcriptional repressor NicS C-terminal domain-containing protein n=1 Tax=Aerosakkonema funiforme FACHB-1375 TaxID=2949571 RepID=A0A926VKS0_9CYAN|nr:hypothetical protein [Aerosakkonema funiforme FACHB-1375]MBD3563014.1 hypothetical protein [Planktothrix sp. FACHB-1355]